VSWKEAGKEPEVTALARRNVFTFENVFSIAVMLAVAFVIYLVVWPIISGLVAMFFVPDNASR
jgi:cell division protein FtsX